MSGGTALEASVQDCVAAAVAACRPRSVSAEGPRLRAQCGSRAGAHLPGGGGGDRRRRAAPPEAEDVVPRAGGLVVIVGVRRAVGGRDPGERLGLADSVAAVALEVFG